MPTFTQLFVQTTFTLAIGLVVSLPCTATDNPKYPAYDFSPSVVYQDPDLVAKSSFSQAEVHAPDAKYPAAYFTPVIIHRAEAQAALPVEAEPQTDPKYPAAYFKPEVVYPPH